MSTAHERIYIEPAIITPTPPELPTPEAGSTCCCPPSGSVRPAWPTDST